MIVDFLKRLGEVMGRTYTKEEFKAMLKEALDEGKLPVDDSKSEIKKEKKSKN